MMTMWFSRGVDAERIPADFSLSQEVSEVEVSAAADSVAVPEVDLADSEVVEASAAAALQGVGKFFAQINKKKSVFLATDFFMN